MNRWAIVRTACWLAAGILTVVSLAGMLARLHWSLDVINHFRPQLLLASVGLLLAGAAFRNRRMIAITGISLVANGWPLAQHIDLHKSKTPDPPFLKVTTLNVLYTNTEQAKVSEFLRQELPDVVVLQEANKNWTSTLESLRDVFPHQAQFHRGDNGTFGLAILSRLPLTMAHLAQLGPIEGNSGLEASFQWEKQSVSLLGLHMHHPTSSGGVAKFISVRDAVSQWARSDRGPAIVLGDMNCTPWSILFTDFITSSGLADTSFGHPMQATRHPWRPDRLLIDHVFLSSHWSLVARQVGPSVGSDHRPVTVTLALKQVPPR